MVVWDHCMGALPWLSSIFLYRVRGTHITGLDWEDSPHRTMEPLMPTIVVDVMPKSELLDPQGKAVSGALGRLGVDTFSNVRIGKRFELTVEGEVTEEVLASARKVAEDVLSNSIIEDVVGIEVVE